MWIACICCPVNTAQCRPIYNSHHRSMCSFIHPGSFLSNCCGLRRLYVRASVLTFSPCAPLPYSLLLRLQPVQVSINLQPGWMATRRLAGVTFGARSECPASSKWQLLHRTRQMLHRPLFQRSNTRSLSNRTLQPQPSDFLCGKYAAQVIHSVNHSHKIWMLRTISLDLYNR
jgi:hypothetical protein